MNRFRLLQLLAAAALAASLAACTLNNAPPVAPPVAPRLDPPDSAVTRRCPGPTTLPAGPMSQQNIERSWGVDRRNLIACGAEKSVLVDYINARDGGLSGGGK